MDFVELIKSVNLIAIIAFIITLFVLFFELRHVFFHKKIKTDNPVIPDFDGNVTSDPQVHATPLHLHEIEETSNSPVNKVVIFILLFILLILIVIIVLGYTLKKSPKKITETQRTETPVPTEVIEIIKVQPTSPFDEQTEIPFDPSTETFPPLSPTPPISLSPSPTLPNAQTTSPIGQVTGAAPTISQSSQSATITTMSSPTTEPTLVVSGNFNTTMLLAIIPFILLMLALVL